MWSRHSSAQDPEVSTSRAATRSAAAVLIGCGRVATGVVFGLHPVQSVRFLGVDSGTAGRVVWLARMTAARDAALGVGTVLSAVTGRGSAGWLLAGAACDAADAAALGHALSRRQVAAVPAAGVIAVASAASAIAVGLVLRERIQTSSRS